MFGFVAIVQRIGEAYPDIIARADELRGHASTELEVAEAALADVLRAWAAGLGSARAIAELEPLFVAAEAHLRARGHASDVAAEAAQRARVSLLTGERKIFTYAGRGALGAFVRVVCVRQALQHARDASRRAVMFDELQLHASDASDPELEVLRGHYREQVDRAMIDAWGQLSRHDRFVLSLHLHAQHSVAELAVIYGIHRVNAARKLAAARTSLLRITRDLLQSELGVSSATASSVLRLTSFGLSVGQLAPATNVQRRAP